MITTVKDILRDIKKYSIFLQSISKLVFSNEEFIIFHIEKWHLFWELERREKLYSQMMPNKVLFIDLGSNFQIFLGRLVLKVTDSDSTLVSSEILVRSMWDKLIQSDIELSSLKSLDNYEKHFSDFRRKILANRRYLFILNFLSNKRVSGVAVIQSCYLDWWIIAAAKELNKLQYLPESPYGFVVTLNYSFQQRINFLNRHKPRLTKAHVDAARISLNNRIIGDYSNSYLKFYMSNGPINCYWEPEKSTADDINIIFYMHAFTDSPNLEIEDIEKSYFIDHYHFLLKFFRHFGNLERFNIYLRSHPSNSLYPADNKFYAQIVDIVKHYRNIHHLPNSVPLASICKKFKNNLFLLTGRGSVTLEGVYVGIPVLNYCDYLYTQSKLAYFFTESNFNLDYFYEILKNHRSNSDLALHYEALNISLQSKMIFDLRSTIKSNSLNLGETHIQYFD